MRRAQSARGLGGLILALLGSACSTSPPAPAPAVADPCSLLTRSDIANAFPGGLGDTPHPLVNDAFSRSCAVPVHSRGGDVTVVVTVADAGPESLRTVCAQSGAAPVQGVGEAACTNAVDQSVSALRHGSMYSLAVTTPGIPQDNMGPLQRLMVSLLARR